MSSAKHLRGHVMATYITLRIGLALLAIALPFILVIGGYYFADEPLRASMSAYYHAGDGIMRDEFVGILVAVGAFLYLYKGFTTSENIALNLAGLFLVGVALFPMEWECGTACSKITLHGAFAVLFFLSIAYVCIFRASDTLSLMQDQVKAGRYKITYKWLGVSMIVAPALAFAVISRLRTGPQEFNPWIFFVEAAGVIVFGLYWIIKSFEIAQSNSELRAIEGKLGTT